MGDLDGDGDLDITGTDERADLIILFENPGVATAVEGETVPSVLTLSAYPNPAAGRVTVRYGLPRSAHVSIDVYDVRGRRVASLVNRRQDPGEHEAAARDLVPGVYMARLRAGGRSTTAPFVVLPRNR